VLLVALALGAGTNIGTGSAFSEKAGDRLAAPFAGAAPLARTGAAADAAGKAATNVCSEVTVVQPEDWTVYGGGATHTGQDLERVPAAGVLYEEWRTHTLDGALYAEPVIADGCVIVATENDSLYAFDGFSGEPRWHDHLAAPVPGSSLPCGDINPSGITGTPVVDVAKGLLWAVVFTEGADGPQHELVGVDAANGRVVSRREVNVPGVSPRAEQQRGALALANGNVYIPFGGLDGDCGDYRGTVVAAPEQVGRRLTFWEVPTGRGGGIWAPAGVDVLGDGSLLFATGNGAARSGERWDGSDAVVRLSRAMHMEGYFAPTDWGELNARDLDLGSSAPAVLPGGLALQVGKDGKGYLVRTGHLGGVGGQLASAPVCPGGGAFGSDAVAGDVVYVPCATGLTAVGASGKSLHVLWHSSSAGPGSPVLAGGKVWEVTTSGVLQGVDTGTGRVVQTLTLERPATHFPWLVPDGPTMYVPDGNTLMTMTGL
jgi:hypothetical protein